MVLLRYHYNFLTNPSYLWATDSDQPIHPGVLVYEKHRTHQYAELSRAVGIILWLCETNKNRNEVQIGILWSSEPDGDYD